ncbi:MAG: aerotolerance regulator BatA [Phycisphaerae bacterium]|nr:aerotolerance regulator BatA [Phycisphaerae bacterium]
MIEFLGNTPWLLLLLLVIPFLWWEWSTGRRQAAIAYSSTSVVAHVPRTWIQRTRWIIPALRSIAITFLIICLVGPMKADAITQVHSDGIAIELVVDRSQSMSALDFERDKRPIDRLEAVKGVVTEFVMGDEEDRDGRGSDLIGLITFGTFADSNSPMTFDHEHLVNILDQIQTAPQDESRTAIGDAVGLAVSKLTALKDREDLRLDDQIKSRIIILLTDGEQTAGELDPLISAHLAAEYGIKIYTIGAGNERNPIFPVTNPRTGQIQYQRAGDLALDEDVLKEMAKITGGRYFRARDLASLKEIYDSIDELERSEIHQQQYMQYEDMAVEPVRIAGVYLPPLLLIPMLALFAEILLASTLYRRLP